MKYADKSSYLAHSCPFTRINHQSIKQSVVIREIPVMYVWMRYVLHGRFRSMQSIQLDQNGLKAKSRYGMSYINRGEGVVYYVVVKPITRNTYIEIPCQSLPQPWLIKIVSNLSANHLHWQNESDFCRPNLGIKSSISTTRFINIIRQARTTPKYHHHPI